MNLDALIHIAIYSLGGLCAVTSTLVLVVLVKERKKPRARMLIQVSEPGGKTFGFFVDHQDMPDLERRLRDLHPQRVDRDSTKPLAT